MYKYLCLLFLATAVASLTQTDKLILHLLRMDEDNYTLRPEEFVEARQRGSTFVEDLAKLNLKGSVMEDVWRILLAHSVPSEMSREDWSKYRSILGTLPEYVFSQLNITDWDLIEYLGTVEGLTPRQLMTLGDMVQDHYGSNLIEQGERLYQLGNLICGFCEKHLREMPPSVFRYLLGKNFFKKIIGCNTEQLLALLHVGMQNTAVGPPSTWTSSTVEGLGYLVCGLDKNQLRQIRDLSCRGLTPAVIGAVPVDVLKEMKKGQKRSLERTALMAWRRKTLDTNSLTYRSSAGPGASPGVACVACLLLLRVH